MMNHIYKSEALSLFLCDNCKSFYLRIIFRFERSTVWIDARWSMIHFFLLPPPARGKTTTSWPTNSGTQSSRSLWGTNGAIVINSTLSVHYGGLKGLFRTSLMVIDFCASKIKKRTRDPFIIFSLCLFPYATKASTQILFKKKKNRHYAAVFVCI